MSSKTKCWLWMLLVIVSETSATSTLKMFGSSEGMTKMLLLGLLVLIDAFIGRRGRQVCGRALAEGYRFLSFGDATLLDRRSQPLDPLEVPR